MTDRDTYTPRLTLIRCAGTEQRIDETMFDLQWVLYLRLR